MPPRLLLRVPVIAALVLAAMALVAGDRVSSQGQPQPQIPRFRTGVEGVVVDVSVLDRERRPVRGLGAADFTILEDGVPQAVSAFTAVDIPDVVAPSTSSASWVREVASDVRRNDDIGDRRVVVILMDDAVPMPAAEVPRARTLAEAAIDSLGPDDPAAVVYALDQRRGQGFTTDRARLKASIGKFNGAIDNMWTMAGDGKVSSVPFTRMDERSLAILEQGAETLRTVADYLSDLPQRRKALLLVSVGIPVDISVLQAGIPGETGMDSSGATGKILLKVRQAIAAAQRSNVSIYGLDPGGLRGEAASLNRDYLEGLSNVTGGFAVTETNDPAPGLRQIVRENSSYYLVGYQPANARAKGALRKIEVRVNRPGVVVRARSGYYEARPEERRAGTAAERPDAALLKAVGAFAPQGDVAMQVAVAPFAMPDRRESAVAIVVRLAQPAPVGVERAVETVQMLVNAYDTGGKRRGSERLDGRVVLRPTPAGEATYELLSRLDLEPGRYELRVGVESALQHKNGSVFYDLDVPDFSKGAVALSGLLVSVLPGVAVAPRDKLAPLVPVVPTTQREFSAGDQVAAFVRVYQPGRKSLGPVDVRATAVDAAGATAFERRETLGADRFAESRAADYLVELPIASLAAGPHLLTVSATSGHATVQRQVRFRVASRQLITNY